MRVAIDVCVSKKAKDLLESMGHQIVTFALEAEPDEEWFHRACETGADCVVTNDKQVQHWARVEGMGVSDYIDGEFSLDELYVGAPNVPS